MSEVTFISSPLDALPIDAYYSGGDLQGASSAWNNLKDHPNVLGAILAVQDDSQQNSENIEKIADSSLTSGDSVSDSSSNSYMNLNINPNG